MTYAAAVLIVENILRNATVLQAERERIDEALRVLKSSHVLPRPFGEVNSKAGGYDYGLKIRVMPPSQSSTDTPNVNDPLPQDDPNWPPAPEQKGPEGPM